jgi:hypothetical protein
MRGNYLSAFGEYAESIERYTSINFFYLIYFEIRYLTAIIFDVTRITRQANNTNTNSV